MNTILASIQPKWCELIANGKKTIEVRKSVPKCCDGYKPITRPPQSYFYVEEGAG